MDLVRACLSAAIAALVLAAALVLTGGAPAPVVAPAASPAPIAAPVITTTTAESATTTTRRPTTTRSTTSASVIADRCTNRTDYASDPRSNAEINSIGARTGRCPRPITATSTRSPGELALDACTAQTGMTRAECIADSAAGNAN